MTAARKLKFGERNSVPNGFAQVMVMMHYSFLEYIRSRRFFILLIITVAIGLLLTGIVAYYRPQSFLMTEQAFYSNWWSSSIITFIIILPAVFFGGDAISGEFQNKTGYFLLNNPIRRSSVYTGKFLAALAGSLIMLLVFTAMTVGNGIYYFGGVTGLFWEALSFTAIAIVTVMGITFFFSSIFKSNSAAIIVTVILLIFIFPFVQSLVANFAHVEPWFDISYGTQIANSVLITPYPPSFQSSVMPLAHGRSITITQYNATIPEGLIIMIVYFIASVVAGLILFEYKQFN